MTRWISAMDTSYFHLIIEYICLIHLIFLFPAVTPQQSISGSGSKEPIANKNAVGHKKSRFRSNLAGLCKLLQSLEVTEGVKDVLKKTPFWCMLDPIISGEVDSSELNCDNFGLSKVIQTYSKDEGGFILGGKVLRLAPSDFKAIFGISGGDKDMEISTDTTNKRVSKDRLTPYVRFGEKLTAAHVRTAILNLASKKVLKKSQQEDMAILIILHLLANFFLPSTVSNVPWGWAPFVTDIERIKEWDWATALCEYMVNYLDSRQNIDVPACHGCVPLIVYAICEHTTVFKPRSPSKFPRYLKWDFHYLQRKVGDMKYSGAQVNDHELVLSEVELKAMNIVRKGDKKDEDIAKDEDELELELEDERHDDKEGDEEKEQYNAEENEVEVDYPMKSTDELYKDITDICEDITLEYEMNDEKEAVKDAQISALKHEVSTLKAELTKSNAKTTKLELELTKNNAKTAKLELELSKTKSRTSKLELEIAALKSQFGDDSKNENIPLQEMMAGLGKRKRPSLETKKKVIAESRQVSKKKTNLKESSTLPVDSRRVTRYSKMIEEIEDPVLKRKREDALESLRLAKGRKVNEYARDLESLAEQAEIMMNEVVEEEDNSKKTRSLIKNVKGRTKRAERAEKKDPNYCYEGKKQEKVVDITPPSFILLGPSQNDEMPIAEPCKGEKDPNYFYEGTKQEKVVDITPPTITLLGSSQDDEKPIAEPCKALVPFVHPKAYSLPSEPEKPTSEPPSKSYVGFKFPNNDICQKLPNEVKEKVLLFDRTLKGEDTYIRSGPGGDLWLNDLSEIWLGNEISTAVVDVYAHILGQKQNEIWAYGTPELKCKNHVGKSFFMPSNAWSFVNGYNNNLIKLYHKSLEEAVNSECRFIHFPMTTPANYDKKTTRSPRPVHWTLMVFDKIERNWKFYNSIRTRSTINRDVYYKNALSVVHDAEKYWNSKVDDSYDVNHWARTKKNEILYQKTSPQQIPGSLDCAIIVMYIMGCYISGEPIAEEISQHTVIDIKVDILSAIINDKWFWSLESYIETLKSAQILDDEEAAYDCQILPTPIIEIPETK